MIRSAHSAEGVGDGSTLNRAVAVNVPRSSSRSSPKGCDTASHGRAENTGTRHGNSSLETNSDSGTAQREVAVKKTCGLTGRTLAFVLCLALPAFAQDAGVSDAPRLPSATRLDNGSVLLSPEAYTAVDTEMKRLQAVERDNALLLERMKKDQEQAKGAAQWVIPLIIGALAGAAIAVPVTLAVTQPGR